LTAFALIGAQYRITASARPEHDSLGNSQFSCDLRLETVEQMPRVLATWRVDSVRGSSTELADRFLGSLVAEPDWIYVAWVIGERIGFTVLHRNADGVTWSERSAAPVFQRTYSATSVAKPFQVRFSEVNPQTGEAKAELHARMRAGDTTVERLVFRYNPDAPPGRRSWKPDARTDQLLGPRLFGDED
jgi:hypothetical protein